MHSITDLNNYSITSIPYTDYREPGVIYTTMESNISQAIWEGDRPEALLGIDISDIINVNNNSLSYTIDMSTCGNIIPTWSNVTANITTTITGNVYTIGNITSVSDWTQIKQPLMIAPIDYTGLYHYTSNVRYQGNVLTQWGSTVTVNDLPELSEPLNYYYILGVPDVIANVPQIVDIENSTYTLDITVSNLIVAQNLTIDSVALSSNTATFNGNASTLNSKLSSIIFYNPNNYNVDWYISYRLINGSSGIITNKTQQILCSEDSFIQRGYDDFHTGNVFHKILNSPTISGNILTGNYTLTISPITANTAANLSATYNGTTLNSTVVIPYTPQLVITGNASVVNGYLSNLNVKSYNSITSDFKLDYKFILPDLYNISRQQTLYYSNLNSPTANLSIIRTYTQNNIDKFSGTAASIIGPEVYDSYTIILSSEYGEFGMSDSDIPLRGSLPALTHYEFSTHVYTYINGVYSRTHYKDPVLAYSFTGNLTQCNLMLSLYKFYPIKGIRGSGTYNYKLYKNSVLIENRTLPIYGSLRTTAIPDQETYTFTSNGYFQPTMYQSRYLYMDLLLVGAGGYDAFPSATTKNGAGGGDVREWRNEISPVCFNLYGYPSQEGYTDTPYPVSPGDRYLSHTHWLLEYPYYYHQVTTPGQTRNYSYIWLHPSQSYQVQVGAYGSSISASDSPSAPAPGTNSSWSRFLDAAAMPGISNQYSPGFAPSTELTLYGAELAGTEVPTAFSKDYKTNHIGWRYPDGYNKADIDDALSSNSYSGGGAGGPGKYNTILNTPVGGGNGLVSTITGTIYGCGQSSKYNSNIGTTPVGSDFGRAAVGNGLVVIKFHE